MKHLSITVIVAIALVGRSVSAEVHFRQATFDDAKKLAAQEHKKIMVDFYTSWCGWCKVLDSKTYTDENVGRIADEKFISIKLDAEHDGRDLAKASKIRGYPTVIFYDETGTEIDRVVGYEDADHFARSLQLASSGGSKAVLDEVNSANPPTDPAKWMTAAEFYQQRNDNEHALTAFQKVVALDPDNKSGLKPEAVYGVASLTTGDAKWGLLEQALTEFPTRSEGQTAALMLIQHDLAIDRAPDAARLIDRWALTHPQDAQAFNSFAWMATQKGVLLDQATAYVKRAVALATDNNTRAQYMDTQAEIAFKGGHKTDAQKIESDAIAQLDPKSDAKLISELNYQLQKFQGEVIDLGDNAEGDNTAAAPAAKGPAAKKHIKN